MSRALHATLHSALSTLLLVLCAATASAQGDSVYFRDVLYLGREYINDHAIVNVDGTWHLFYTRGDLSIRPWMSPGNEIDLGHAVSADLLTWTTRAPVLAIGAAGAPDAAHVYAPGIVRDGDRWRMLYTGNARGFFSGERILSAVSGDLSTWTKDPLASGPLPDSAWAAWYPPGYDSGGGGPISCRDPFILRDRDGGYICYYVARLRDAGDSIARACVAAATSRDLVEWADRGPVLTRPVMGDDINPFTHPESPCVVERGGKYYLFWKGGSGTRYVMSDDPLDFENREERLLATSHASKVFEWRGEWFITSCSRQVNDVMHTQSDRTRGLYLAGLAWDGDRPRVTALPEALGVVDEAARERPSIKPNPARAGDIVRLDGLGGETRVTLVDLVGRKCELDLEHTGAGARLDTRGLAPGVYVLRAGGTTMRLLITE